MFLLLGSLRLGIMYGFCSQLYLQFFPQGPALYWAFSKWIIKWVMNLNKQTSWIQLGFRISFFWYKAFSEFYSWGLDSQHRLVFCFFRLWFLLRLLQSHSTLDLQQHPARSLLVSPITPHYNSLFACYSSISPTRFWSLLRKGTVTYVAFQSPSPCPTQGLAYLGM